MSCDLYRALVGAICLAAGSPAPHVPDGTEIGVGGTRFTLRHGGDAAPGVMTIYTDFGALPARAREGPLLHLLESNLYMSGAGDRPCFGFNPETGHVVLLSAYELAGATPDKVLNMPACYAASSAGWRRACGGPPQAARPRREPGTATPRQHHASI